YVQLFLIRASIIARKEMAMRLLDVCWRDDAGPECAIEGSRIELCAVEGSLVSNMCAGGKVWANCGASPSSAHQKQEIGQAFPPAHTYSGSFSFGLREWTITKLSRPFFSIEQSR